MESIKSFLRSIRDERNEIAQIRHMIDSLHPEIPQGATRYDGVKVQGQLRDPMSDYIDRLGEYQERLQKHMDELERRVITAETMIESIPASDQRQILRAYYLDPQNPTWEEVVESVPWESRRVYQLHRKGLLWLYKHKNAVATSQQKAGEKAGLSGGE